MSIRLFMYYICCVLYCCIVCMPSLTLVMIDRFRPPSTVTADVGVDVQLNSLILNFKSIIDRADLES